MAVWPYSTAQWQRLRLVKIAAQPWCEMHLRRGVLVPTSHVDHKVTIASGGDPFPPLEGLSGLCASCHSVKTSARDNPFAFGGGGLMRGTGVDGLPLDDLHPFLEAQRPVIEWAPTGLLPSAIPLTIVAGPPASGKSTYVETQGRPGDTVIDLDLIAADLSGCGLHSWPGRWVAPAIAERNRRLAALGRKHGSSGSAWLILTQALGEQRQWWCDRLQPQRVVVLETPEAVCIERIKADPERAHQQRKTIRAVQTWWSRYTRRRGEEIVFAEGV